MKKIRGRSICAILLGASTVVFIVRMDDAARGLIGKCVRQNLVCKESRNEAMPSGGGKKSEPDVLGRKVVIASPTAAVSASNSWSSRAFTLFPENVEAIYSQLPRVTQQELMVDMEQVSSAVKIDAAGVILL